MRCQELLLWLLCHKALSSVRGIIKVMGTFYKGNNFCGFLFAFLEDRQALKEAVLVKKRVCSFMSKSNFCLFEG